VIPYARGLETAGAYSVVPIICQGFFYLPNTLALVMFPRFQERYGETQTAASLRRFVEIPLHVLGDVLLAAVLVLMVALPPMITAYFPDYAGSIAPLPVMLVATYFLCLSPPAGQFLLTIDKQVQLLFIAVPAMCLALGAGYAGAASGLVGVAAGIMAASFALFVGINVYAFSHLGGWWQAIKPVLQVSATAAVVFVLGWAISEAVPTGGPFATVGGWRLLTAAAVALPLLARAVRRLGAMSTPTGKPPDQAVFVDNRPADH
jgi:O-antigen/teichoic acid export membrane protein